MTYRFVDEKRLRFAQLVLLALAVVWGFDYFIQPIEAAVTLTVVEKAAPLPAWGFAFLFFGAMGLIGELWMETGRHHPNPHNPDVRPIWRAENRWWPSFIAHAALLSLYTAVGFGYVLEMATNWHLWGVRSPFAMFSFAVGHWVFMRRRKNV
jgi:hypothetical protein